MILGRFRIPRRRVQGRSIAASSRIQFIADFSGSLYRFREPVSCNLLAYQQQHRTDEITHLPAFVESYLFASCEYDEGERDYFTLVSPCSTNRQHVSFQRSPV